MVGVPDPMLFKQQLRLQTIDLQADAPHAVPRQEFKAVIVRADHFTFSMLRTARMNRKMKIADNSF